MNRIEFMKQLDALLQDISESERKEAIQYYNDYFDDAGTENEVTIIEQLNSPERVAETIKAGLSEDVANGEFSETGFQDNRFEEKNEVITESEVVNLNSEQGEQVNQEKDEKKKEEKKKDETVKIVLIVLACILAIPIGIPMFSAVVGTIIGIFSALIGILIGIFAATIGTLLTGIVLVGAGIVKLFVAPATGLVFLGAGLLVIAVGILLLLLSIWILTKVIPFFIKGVASLFRKIFAKKGGSVA